MPGAAKANASEASENSEFCTAAVNAAKASTLKKPTCKLTDDTSEKEIEAFKKPICKLSAYASEFEPFKKPLPTGRLTGKKEEYIKSCIAYLSKKNKEYIKNPWRID